MKTKTLRRAAAFAFAAAFAVALGSLIKGGWTAAPASAQRADAPVSPNAPEKGASEAAPGSAPGAKKGGPAQSAPEAPAVSARQGRLGPALAPAASAGAAPSPKGAPANPSPATDPLARIALASVGLDDDATEYWLSAINDPALPPGERKDLIEDLNEDGFANPDHPSAAELPLIWNRLALIEEIATDATDAINAAAFAEAYKDLLAMAEGKPHD